MNTYPSIEALGNLFSCVPEIEAEHPEYGILSYRVEFDTATDRVSLSVLPVAEEVSISLFTKQPSRFIRLSLEDVSQLIVMKDEKEEALEIHFHNDNVQTLRLQLHPVIMLNWGNQHDSPDRHPPWERD